MIKRNRNRKAIFESRCKKPLLKGKFYRVLDSTNKNHSKIINKKWAKELSGRLIENNKKE